MATIKRVTAVCAFYFDITVFLIPGSNAILASQTGEEYKSHFLRCASSHASLCLLSSLPSRFQCPESGQWGLLHSLFLFPMHILLWDLTLKRHKAWENGAAEVFHQADSHFIIFSAWQLTSKCAFAHSLSHTHTHTLEFQPVLGLRRKSAKHRLWYTGCRYFYAPLIIIDLFIKAQIWS